MWCILPIYGPKVTTQSSWPGSGTVVWCVVPEYGPKVTTQQTGPAGAAPLSGCQH